MTDGTAASAVLVSHYSAMGDTISMPPILGLWRNRFQGQAFLHSKPCLWSAIGHFHGKKRGCSSDSLRYHRKHSATGVLLHLSRDMGGYLGRVTKSAVACFG